MTKKKSESVIAVEDAELEAYSAVATAIQGADFLIRACDGDNEYVWVAEKRAKTYRVVEVYPGLKTPKTNVRDAEGPEDLVLHGRFRTIEDVCEDINETLLGDLVPEEITPPERQLRAAN